MQATCQVSNVMVSTFSFLEQAKCIYRTFKRNCVNTCNEICKAIIVLLYQAVRNTTRRVPNHVRVSLRQRCFKENPELFADRAADMSVTKNTAHNVIKEVIELDV